MFECDGSFYYCIKLEFWYVILAFNIYMSYDNVIGEANFVGGEASVKGVKGFDPEAAKKRVLWDISGEGH